MMQMLGDPVFGVGPFKGSLHVVVTLPVKLTGTGQLKPGFEVLGRCAMQPGLLGMAGVVEIWLGGGQVCGLWRCAGGSVSAGWMP